MTRQLSRELPDLDPPCLQKHFKGHPRAEAQVPVVYDLLKETEQTVTSHLSREPSDLDPPCFQKRFKGTNEHIAQVPLVLVYDQKFQISISKQSRP